MSTSAGPDPHDSHARSSYVVMACTLISRLLGFVKIAIIGALFGAEGHADALNAAFSVPNNLRKLLAEGALSSAFIPVLSRSLGEDRTGKKAVSTVRLILSFQAVVVIPICAAAILFADPLIRHVLSEFKDPALISLGTRLLQWFMGYLFLISVSAVIMGVLQSHSRFLIPALSPILFSVAVIGSLIALHKQMGVFSMAVGVLTGGVGQLVFQIPLFRTLGYDFKPSFDFRDPDFRRVLRQWLPVLATASIFTVTQQVAIRFATGLEEGSASAMNYAIVFWQLPFGVFSASITTVLFPKMSREAGSNLTGELRETVGYGLRSLYVFLIPSAVLLIVFGKEIISVAMFRRRFDEAATLLTARVMMGYAIGLWSVGAYTFLQRFFYSVGDYRTPVVSAGIIAVLDITLSLWLKETALRVTGLAVANSVSFTVGTAFFLVSAHSRLNGLPWRKMAKTFGKVTVVMVPILCIGVFYLRFTGDWWRNGSSFGSFGLLAAGGGGSLALVLLGYRLAKVEAIITMARRRKR